MPRTTQTNRNLAARMGRWSASHWKTATFGWLAFVVVAFALGGAVGTKTIDQSTAGPGESGRMDRILEAGFKPQAAENVLIQSSSARVGTAAFDAAIADVVARVSKVGDVQNLRSPLAPGNADQISKDGQSALVAFDIRGEKDEAVDKIAPVLDEVATAQRPIRPSRSASSVTRARRRRSRRRTPRTSERPGFCRCRLRWPSSCSHSARSWRPESRCCSR